MCYVHNQWYDILCSTLYVYICRQSVTYDYIHDGAAWLFVHIQSVPTN